MKVPGEISAHELGLAAVGEEVSLLRLVFGLGRVSPLLSHNLRPTPLKGVHSPCSLSGVLLLLLLLPAGGMAHTMLGK